MEKNNALTIIFLIVVIVGVGGYYLYQKVGIPGLPGGEDSGVVSYAGKECPLLGDITVDALFEKIEDNWLYFYSKDKVGSVERAKLSEETIFSKATFSPELETIKEENINSSEIKDNDGVSIVVFCGKEATDEKIVRAVKLIEVLREIPAPAAQ